MKKILLITYFFPPSNFAGSYRLASFAKYFHKYGYYPVVVTRQAPENAGSFREMAQNCGRDVIFEKHEGYEVHFLPYKANLRDKILAKYGDKKYVYIRRILSFFEMLLQAVTPYAIPYANLYRFSKNYLKSHNDIHLIITSGKPFQLFLFAHLLSKKFKIPWVADYRDEWNSWVLYNNIKISLREKILFLIERFYEKKWTKNAALIVTVTEHWANNIASFLKKDCKVVMNGYDFDSIMYPINKMTDKSIHDIYTIVHLGTLYENQQIEIFIDGIIKLIKKNYKIRCLFPGVINGTQNIDNLIKRTENFKDSFYLLPRIEQNKVYEMMSESDAFLMVGYSQYKGWMSSKVLEYMPFHKPIILCPSDHDIIEDLLNPFSKKIICNTAEEVSQKLKMAIQERELNAIFNEADQNYFRRFSRENQAKNFASLLEGVKTVKNRQVKVLCFHSISDEYNPAYPSIPVNVFDKLVKYLISKYQIVGVDELEMTARTKVILTFDDGYEDFYIHVYPLIKKYQIKVVLGIIPGLIDSGDIPWTQKLNNCIESAYTKNKIFEIAELGLSKIIKKRNIQKIAAATYLKLSVMNRTVIEKIIKRLVEIHQPRSNHLLNWAQIKEMQASGLIEIACHSMTHNNLCLMKSDDDLTFEIVESREIIEKKTGFKTRIFVAPNGFYNDSVLKKVFDAKYKYLFGVNDFDWDSASEVVPRILMRYRSYIKNVFTINLIIPRIRMLLYKKQKLVL